MGEVQVRKSLKSRLKENYLGIRLLFGLLSVICLTLFLHFREVRLEVLEIHSTANRFIVAQVDFEFPDEEATIILRQDILRDIGSVFRIDDKEVRQARYEFEKYLIENPDWKKSAPSSTYEEVYEAADAMENVLIALRFTDPRTLQKMKDNNLPTDDFLLFTPSQDKKLPANYWESVKDFSFTKILQEEMGHVGRETIDFVVNFFEKKSWNLIHDILQEENFKKLIEKSIPQKFTRIKAGSRLISQGEKITSRHTAMLQAMKAALDESRNLFNPLTIFGNVILSIIFVLLSILYFRIDQKEILKSFHKLGIVVSALILTLGYSKITEYILLQSSHNLIETVHFPLIMPFTALLLSMLLNRRIALFMSAFLSIILSVVLAFDHSRFLIVNLIVSAIVIVSTQSLRRRKDVFTIAMISWLGIIPVIFSYSFIHNVFWSSSILVGIGCSLVFTIINAVLVVGILPVLEYLFNVMTDITLLEYMDPGSELLKRMTLEIPGTYQHSLVLGNIAESVATAIQANGLFCRVATLYHDIGKLNNPHYFTENQQSGVNIHQLLTPQESAQVIISHVRDGEMIARKYHLPESFIDVIKEHHGTTLVYYFYYKELELKGDPSLIDEQKFRYPGPKPRSKESAIIMIADSVEAASRSMEDVSEEALEEMVGRVVKDKAEDGQFDNCPLTFEELSIIKKRIVKTLVSTRHVRVKYPEKRELEEI